MNLPFNSSDSVSPQELKQIIEELREDNARLRKENECLQQTQAHYTCFYEEIPAGYVVFDSEGRVSEVNHTAVRMLEMPAGNLEGLPLINVVCADDQDLFRKNFALFMATGKPARYEVRLLKGDSVPFWVEMKLKVLTGKDGQPLFCAVLTDITNYHEVVTALKESEERYRLVSTLIYDYIFKLEVRDDGNVVMDLLTDGFHRDTGLSFDDVKTPDLWENIIHPDDYVSFMAAFKRLVSEGGNQEIECRTLVKGKRMRWVRIAARAVTDVGMTHTVSIVGSVKDISKHKRMESALIERSRQLYNLSDNLPNVMIYQVIGDLNGNRRFTYVGRSIERLNEISVNELLDDPDALYRQILPEYQPLVARLEREALEKQAPVEVEVQSKLPSGRLRWFRFTSTPRKLDDGTMVWDGVETDITDRKEIELNQEERIAERTLALSKANTDLEHEIKEHTWARQALKESEWRLLEAQRISHVGSWHLDLETDTAHWSEELYRIAGISPHQLVKGFKDGPSMFTEESWRKLSSAVNATINSGEPYEVQACLIRPDGERRYIICRGRPEKNEGGAPKSLFGTVQDITEWKKAEEKRQNLEAQIQHAQKMESLGVLAGGIAHDFNNILQIILANVNMMQRLAAEYGNLHFFIENIEKSVLRAASLTRQMLAYSGKAHVSPERMDINNVVREMVRLIQSSMAKNIEIKMELMRGLPAIEGDIAQIQQVIMNIVINACEALDKKQGGVVTVKSMVQYCTEVYLRENQALNMCKEGDYVCLEVADSGCGMDKETQTRLFEPFFSTKFTGRGLGMAAVLGIMRSHEGSILIDSVPGRGTTIQVLFPILSTHAADLGESSPVVLSPPPEDAGTILFVDDEPEMVELSALSLRQLGYKVFTASDGVEAIEIFKQHCGKIDCVLLDLSMPRMDGAQALTELRRIKPDVRIVFMSGWAEQELEMRFADKHVQGYIEKPYDIDTLAQKLKDALR